MVDRSYAVADKQTSAVGPAGPAPSGTGYVHVTAGVVDTPSDSLTLPDGHNLIVGTSSGAKIGTAAAQKIGHWNATPIVQPTTGVAAASFTANTSGIADNTATFDGYTIGQVVKALRLMGLLA